MPAEILIYGVIGETWFDDGITAKGIAEQLKAISDSEINVRINSPGGSVFEGVAIYNQLVAHPARIVVDIDGAALSCGSLIAMAGDTIRMAENALLMIHRPATMTFGNEDDHEETIRLLRKVEGNIVQTYRTRVDSTEEELIAAMKATTWYTAAEAKEAGFVDEVTGKGQEPRETRNRFDRLSNALKRPGNPEETIAAYRSIEHKQRELLLTKIKVLT